LRVLTLISYNQIFYVIMVKNVVNLGKVYEICTKFLPIITWYVSSKWLPHPTPFDLCQCVEKLLDTKFLLFTFRIRHIYLISVRYLSLLGRPK